MVIEGGWGAAEAEQFCREWLPVWTGNQPERLVSFYTDDAFYSDPAVPEGLRGRDHILSYFRRLLRAYPEWVWTHRRSQPVPHGFLNYWRADIPMPERIVACTGVCVVQLRRGRIYRNEVFFDRSELLARGS